MVPWVALALKHTGVWMTGLGALLLAEGTLRDPWNFVLVIIPVAAAVLAGFFTLRSNVAKVWRENYDAEVEKNKILQSEVLNQRELKHNALNEANALRLELAAERAKPNLEVLAAKLDVIQEEVRKLQQAKEG